MEFSKDDIVRFLNIALQTKIGEGCGPQTKEANQLPDAFEGLSVKASVGMGCASVIPWISFTGFNQRTNNGIYPVLLYYRKRNILIISFGVSATNTPNYIWNIEGFKTIKDFFSDKNISLDANEKNYNSSFVHSAYHVPVKNDVNGTTVLDEENFELDNVINSLKVVCTKYKRQFQTNNTIPSTNVRRTSFGINNIISAIKQTGLLYEDRLIQRYACSLMTKPFVILSGLAGSGKTQLALAFARVMSEDVEQQMCVVPVGADWTNREPLLGYPNALKPTEYMEPESGVLQIMMRAQRNPQKPYFLVLDEMNLSYVERYLADILSALESHQEIPLWEKDEDSESDVPAKIALPKNLFITGTINVDETTYMFSPKVLDRANVIEFKITDKEMEIFLKQDKTIDIHAADGECASMGQDFVNKAIAKETDNSELAQETLIKFFRELKKVNAEFGYRSATEIYRFIANAKACAEGMTEDEILDAAIVQKLLPKLHGSRKKLEPALKALWGLCMMDSHTTEAIMRKNLDYAKFPESADKIQRMMQTALDNGFTSFAEA